MLYAEAVINDEIFFLVHITLYNQTGLVFLISCSNVFVVNTIFDDTAFDLSSILGARLPKTFLIDQTKLIIISST